MTVVVETCLRCGSPRLAHCTDPAGEHRSGYLPRDLGIGGEDVHFVCCLDCGQIQGRFPLPPTGLEEGRDGVP